MERFGAVRIQHGIGAVADAAVVRLLKEKGIACDVCPGSNLALKSVATAEAHPLRQMLEEGLAVTLGSDDPPMFQTSLLQEYRWAAEWCALDDSALLSLAENSLRHSFAPQECITFWCETLHKLRP